MFFFNDTATTEIYTLSLHDALPISRSRRRRPPTRRRRWRRAPAPPDRKSTRLNSSHANISYAVFCLKKKKPCRCLWWEASFVVSRCHIVDCRQETLARLRSQLELC